MMMLVHEILIDEKKKLRLFINDLPHFKIDRLDKSWVSIDYPA